MGIENSFIFKPFSVGNYSSKLYKMKYAVRIMAIMLVAAVITTMVGFMTIGFTSIIIMILNL